MFTTLSWEIATKHLRFRRSFSSCVAMLLPTYTTKKSTFDMLFLSPGSFRYLGSKNAVEATVAFGELREAD